MKCDVRLVSFSPAERDWFVVVSVKARLEIRPVAGWAVVEALDGYDEPTGNTTVLPVPLVANVFGGIWDDVGDWFASDGENAYVKGVDFDEIRAIVPPSQDPEAVREAITAAHQTRERKVA